MIPVTTPVGTRVYKFESDVMRGSRIVEFITRSPAGRRVFLQSVHERRVTRDMPSYLVEEVHLTPERAVTAEVVDVMSCYSAPTMRSRYPVPFPLRDHEVKDWVLAHLRKAFPDVGVSAPADDDAMEVGE